MNPALLKWRRCLRGRTSPRLQEFADNVEAVATIRFDLLYPTPRHRRMPPTPPAGPAFFQDYWRDE